MQEPFIRAQVSAYLRIYVSFAAAACLSCCCNLTYFACCSHATIIIIMAKLKEQRRKYDEYVNESPAKWRSFLRLPAPS